MLRPRRAALTAFRLCALLVALTYGAFRTELIEREREEFLPKCPASGSALASPGVNWETFDKDNAPKALRIVPAVVIEPLGAVPALGRAVAAAPPRVHPVRDKSPPVSEI